MGHNPCKCALKQDGMHRRTPQVRQPNWEFLLPHPSNAHLPLDSGTPTSHTRHLASSAGTTGDFDECEEFVNAELAREEALEDERAEEERAVFLELEEKTERVPVLVLQLDGGWFSSSSSLPE